MVFFTFWFAKLTGVHRVFSFLQAEAFPSPFFSGSQISIPSLPFSRNNAAASLKKKGEMGVCVLSKHWRALFRLLKKGAASNKIQNRILFLPLASLQLYYSSFSFSFLNFSIRQKRGFFLEIATDKHISAKKAALVKKH